MVCSKTPRRHDHTERQGPPDSRQEVLRQMQLNQGPGLFQYEMPEVREERRRLREDGEMGLRHMPRGQSHRQGDPNPHREGDASQAPHVSRGRSTSLQGQRSKSA
jgi:hypothetical protein